MCVCIVFGACVDCYDYVVCVLMALGGSKRHILQAVPLPDLQFFLGKPAIRIAGWPALLLTKAGYVETNPGPTTLNKQVWLCDICYKQMHVRKQISIRCNRIEH